MPGEGFTPLDYTPPEWSGRPSLEGDFSLELIVKGEVKARIALDTQSKEYFVLGRARQCDVSLEKTEPRASRLHCVLQCRKDKPELYIYDLGSSHGTLLNNQHIPARSWEVIRVGQQLRFCAEKPGPQDCIAVLCGPEEGMEEEGDVDLEGYRAQTKKEREQFEKDQEKDLLRRKRAKAERIYAEKKKAFTLNHYAEKAKEMMKEKAAAEEEDRQKLHEVTWGMTEDATKGTEDLSDEALKLMDSVGGVGIDPEKVLALPNVTEKQSSLCAKLEQKRRKLANLNKEKERLERKVGAEGKNKREGMSTEFDFDDARSSSNSAAAMEGLQRVEAKIDQVTEEICDQSDNILLSLGLKNARASRKIRKAREALYDTNLYSTEDDDFFDRTTDQATVDAQKKVKEVDLGAPDAGLPDFDKVETLETIEVKVKLLSQERVRLNGQLATERALGARKSAPAPDDEEEDELDAYMKATHKGLSGERESKIVARLEIVEQRYAKAKEMHALAKVNNESTQKKAKPAVPVFAAKEAAKREVAKVYPKMEIKEEQKLDSKVKMEEMDESGVTQSVPQEPPLKKPKKEPVVKEEPLTDVEGDADKAEDADFQASETHTGSREGFVFKAGPKGVGYYRDKGSVAMASEGSPSSASAATGSSPADVVQKQRGALPARADPPSVKVKPDVAGVQTFKRPNALSEEKSGGAFAKKLEEHAAKKRERGEVEPEKPKLADVLTMPPPQPKVKKVYGVTPRPVSRDADEGQSGE